MAELPEHRLLRACASDADFVPGRLELARSVRDWDGLLELARRHRLLPLLAFQLRSCAPPSVAGRLRQAWLDSAGKSLLASMALTALLASMREAGIPALPLKGPALAESLYEDPAMRPFSDLDILVRKADLGRALPVLATLGYLLPSHLTGVPASELRELTGEVLLRSKEGLAVDLHWTVAGGGSVFEFDPEILWREAPELTPESLLLFLCVHGAKHMWARLGWLADIARLVPKIRDWGRALALAEEAGALRSALLGLSLARDLLGARVPQEIVERSDREVKRLTHRVSAGLFAPAEQDPSSWELTAFAAAMARSPRQKVLCYLELLRAPTEAELQLLRLPRGLYPLYYPVRFYRLARKLARRA